MLYPISLYVCVRIRLSVSIGPKGAVRLTVISGLKPVNSFSSLPIVIHLQNLFPTVPRPTNRFDDGLWRWLSSSCFLVSCRFTQFTHTRIHTRMYLWMLLDFRLIAWNLEKQHRKFYHVMLLEQSHGTHGCNQQLMHVVIETLKGCRYVTPRKVTIWRNINTWCKSREDDVSVSFMLMV